MRAGGSETGREQFLEKWIGGLITEMDRNLDESTKTRLMESCGRACARRGAVRAAEACQGDLRKLLSTLGSWIGKDNVQQSDGTVRVTYPKCLCELVAEGPERLPDTYCLCSCGWLKEMFETVTRKPVSVELLESIKRGGSACRFVVRP